MSPRRDESLLTAYALGEVDAAQRAEVEAWLEESEEARAQLEEIRQGVAFLEEEFASEPAPELTGVQRAAIAAAAGNKNRSWSRWLYPAVGLAAAASLAVVVGVRMMPELRQISQPTIEVTPGPAAAATDPVAAGKRDLEKPEGQSFQDGEQAPVRPEESRREDLASRETRSESRAAAVDRVADAMPADPPSESRSAQAQISGSISDEVGAVVPGAEVVLRDEVSGLQRTVISNDSGRYQFSNVPPGRYRMVTELPGFKKAEEQFEVVANEQKELDARLELGEVSEMVVVSAEPDPSPTSNAATTPSSLAEAEQKSMPAQGRDALQLMPSAPPVTVQEFAMAAGARSREERRMVERGRVAEDEDRPLRKAPDFNTESYDRIVDNPFIRVADDPRSTFSIDVDTASYANVRRFLTGKQLPPKDAVRIEEMINYFNYAYAAPAGPEPFSTHIEVTSAPWQPKHRLLRVGLKGKDIDMSRRPAGNFVFLLDVSGSMDQPNKLPLVKKAVRLLVDELGPQDRIALVVYAGASGLVLPSTACNEKQSILEALDRLQAGGSTNGGQGIQLAYQVAQQHFIRDGINRVILATDGDFNVGVTSQGDLTRLIEEKARSGVFLSVLGFGMGNYQDSNLEKLADQGNGNYAYIDTVKEARKVLVEEVGGTLVTIAKDVKIQLEFNPARVNAFRLIGYENRLLEHQDFNDDTKDAGEIGAGHTVTALYEVVPAGVDIDLPTIDPLKYQNEAAPSADASRELLTVKLRYKQPDGDTSQLIEVPVIDAGGEFSQASTDVRFAAAVAGFGMLLRDSPYKGSLTFEDVVGWADASRGADKGGYRSELVKLVRAARALHELEGLQQ